MKKQQNSKFQKFVTRCNDLISSFFENIPHYHCRFNAYVNKSPYARLMRLHKPIGIQLLLLPVLWTLVSASSNIFQFIMLSSIFTVGAVAMRGAGCIINDIVDRNIDKEVERTKDRPVASGELSISQAMKPLTLLLGISFAILLFLPIKSIFFGVLAALLVVAYPFMKRYNDFPQVFLGFAFNLGVFISWFASQSYFSFVPVLIYIAAIFWTTGYDTIYAHQDKKYDEKIGVRSMAVILGDRSKEVVKYFYKISIFALGIAGLNANLNVIFFLVLGVGFWKLNEQIDSVDLDSQEDCQNKFQSNFDYGLLILLGFILGKL